MIRMAAGQTKDAEQTVRDMMEVDFPTVPPELQLAEVESCVLAAMQANGVSTEPYAHHAPRVDLTRRFGEVRLMGSLSCKLPSRCSEFVSQTG
jgi:hypothetical protein